MVDVVEAAFDIALDNPGIWHSAPSAILIALMRQGGTPEMLQSAMGAPSGSKPVGDMPELRLEDWLQENFDRALNDAIFNRGDAQGSELSWFSRLGDEHAPRWAGSICAGAQFGLKSIKKALLADLGADASHGHPVDPGGAFASVGGHAPPSVAKHCGVGEPTPHVPPCIVGICLAPLIEFALNAEYPSLIDLMIHVHGSFLRRTSLSSSCFPSPCAWFSHAPTTAEAPPSVSPFSGRRG